MLHNKIILKKREIQESHNRADTTDRKSMDRDRLKHCNGYYHRVLVSEDKWYDMRGSDTITRETVNKYTFPNAQKNLT
jgi:hypothetical protein